jgi:hypothetical protein
MHQNYCISSAIQQVERTELNQLLISGNCQQYQWATFLNNQRACHAAIEAKKVITQAELMRTGRLSQDLSKMGYNCKNPKLPLSYITQAFVNYVSSISVSKLWAHIYLRYLIDIGTSSLIKVSINLPSVSLDFDNSDLCLNYIREHMIDIDEEEMDSALNWLLTGYDQLYWLIKNPSEITT